MPLSFSRSLRALDAERAAGVPRFYALLAGLAAAWSLWFFGARVPLLASTDSARLEVTRAAHRVQAPVSGRVLAVHQELGRAVAAGELLVELDASAQERELEQRLAEQEAARVQLAALRDEIRAAESTLGSQREAARAHVEEADLRERQAQALARVAHIEGTRSQDLLDAGVISPAESLRRISAAEQQRGEADASAAAQRRVRADQRVAERDREHELAELRREAAALDGRLEASTALIASARRQAEQRRVRAPVAGRLGELAPLTAGAFVEAGALLASVIPEGELHIVAYLAPAVALGRIQAGQPARMQLFGFPWTQYGALEARVEHVAREVDEAGVRVELALAGSGPAAIPLQHGLPGRVQIEIEQTSPAALVWRAVGGGGAPARAPVAP